MSTGLSAFTCTPRQIRKHVIRCITVGLVPFIKSSPAMGKSAIVHSIADEYNLELIDHRISTSTPEDFSGLPKLGEDTAKFVPFENFPVEGTPLPKVYDDDGKVIGERQGWILFLDEFNSGGKLVQAASYKLVLDKMVGLRKLHPNVVIIAAGNKDSDRAIVNPLSTAMQSRLITLNMVLNHKEFMIDVAFKQHWDSRVIAYLSYKESALHDFRPDHNEDTFCAPRTWEFVNRLIKGQEYRMIKHADGSTHYEMDEEAALYAGAITSGVATDFITFTKVFHLLPKIDQIVRDPTNTDLPIDSQTRFATITHLIEQVTDDIFIDVATYVNRLPAEFRVLFFRGLLIQKPELRKHQAFRQAMVSLSRYLHDDDIPAAA